MTEAAVRNLECSGRVRNRAAWRRSRIERENEHRRALGSSLLRRLDSSFDLGPRDSNTTRRARVRKALKSFARWLWDATRWILVWPMKWIIGNGYKPLQAFWWALALIVFGTFAFSFGDVHGQFVPTEKDTYAYYSCRSDQLPSNFQQFNPFIYSMENFLPLIELGQRKNWAVRSFLIPRKLNCLRDLHSNGWLPFHLQILVWLRGHIGWLAADAYLVLLNLFRWPIHHMLGYLWFHIIFGWFVAGIFLAGVTGLVRRE